MIMTRPAGRHLATILLSVILVLAALMAPPPAQAADDPPGRFYIVDQRDPDDVFSTGFAPKDKPGTSSTTSSTHTPNPGANAVLCYR